MEPGGEDEFLDMYMEDRISGVSGFELDDPREDTEPCDDYPDFDFDDLREDHADRDLEDAVTEPMGVVGGQAEESNQLRSERGEDSDD